MSNNDQQQTTSSSQRVLEALRDAREQIESLKKPRDQRVAIIGMAARLPGAESVDEFWQMLIDGRSGVRMLSEEELREAGVSEAMLDRDDYVPAWASFDDPAAFDAGFFGYSPREATVLDPQHRVFLECAWNALEDAGHDTAKRDVRVGVYAGAALNSYLVALNSDAQLRESVNPVEAVVSNVVGLMPTRVSYHLDLTGPSCGVQTGCSTSLVSVHHACRSLLDGDCDVALAGGVTIGQTTPAGYIHEPGGIASPDGTCRAFDAEGRGTLFGNGVGVVVLKPLAKAQADGDNILAVIAGSAINNDGSDKVGLLAPSVSGQSAVIQQAWDRAGADPASVDYIEAHGTATELGDPIEFAALQQAIGKPLADGQKSCALGSVKTNVGHLDAAAGITGLIKTVLALKHETIPPSLNFKTPNPQIDMAASPFFVADKAQPWPRGEIPRRAGVSSFGMGGTNAHVVVEEAPSLEVREQVSEKQWRVLPLSAHTPSALKVQARRLSARLKAEPGIDLADVAYTLQTGRCSLQHRRICIARNRDEAISALEGQVVANMQGTATDANHSIVFMFTGQGSQYPGMARVLYATEPVFRKALDQCVKLLAQINPDMDLMELISANTDPQVLNRTEHAQPALFALEYALAVLWRSRGVEPDAMIGHSVGEYVAACLAGVFSLEDALSTVVARGRLMQACAPGAMLAVLQERSQVEPLLGEGIELAAHNAAQSCVVSGPEGAIEALRQKLDAENIACKRLETSHAFHSEMMVPALDAFAKHLSTITLNTPTLDIVSNLSGEWLRDEQATDPAYWVAHLRHTVCFADGLETLKTLSDPVYIEIGPGEALTRFVGSPAEAIAIPSLPPARQVAHGARWFAQACGRLWLQGVSVDWNCLLGTSQETLRKVSLPGYPFERIHYYPEVSDTPLALNPSESVDEKAAVEDWFYVPSWDRVARPQTIATDEHCWLVFGSAAEQSQFKAPPGVTLLRVQPEENWAETDSGLSINPRSVDDFIRLFDYLSAQPKPLTQWIHLATDDRDDDHMGALITLSQALLKSKSTDALLLSVITAEQQSVVGGEKVDPTRATLAGLCQVLPQELAGLSCRMIDLSGSEIVPAEQRLLHNELCSDYDHQARIIALRGAYRWQQTWRSMSLFEKPEQQVVGNEAPLKRDATYVIVGDLASGLGMIYARLLRRELNAKLILIGREDLPSSDQWEHWLATHGTLHPFSQFIQRMKALGNEGVDWHLDTIDIGDAATLKQSISHGVMRLGPITGVFHADVMGDAASCSLADLDDEERSRIMHHKVDGCSALAAALDEHKAEFVVLQSSLSALVGGPGFAAYAAANHFLDAFASSHEAKAKNDTRWISINWDACQLDDGPQVTGTALMAAALEADEVWQATQRVLGEPALAHVAVSPRPLLPRIDAAFDPDLMAAPVTGSSHSRPDLDTAYVEPRTPIEQAVASAMAELLGISQVGVDDDFFALGGNSLLAIQAVTRLRKEFGVELPMRAFLYGTPTVAGIAKVIEENLADLSQDEMSAVEDLLDEIENLSPDEAAEQL